MAVNKYYWISYTSLQFTGVWIFKETVLDDKHPFEYIRLLNGRSKTCVLLNWKEITEKEYLLFTNNLKYE